MSGHRQLCWDRYKVIIFTSKIDKSYLKEVKKRPHWRSVCFAPFVFVPRYKNPCPHFGLKVYPNVLSRSIYLSLSLPPYLSLLLTCPPSLAFSLSLSLCLCLGLVDIESVQAPQVPTVRAGLGAKSAQAIFSWTGPPLDRRRGSTGRDGRTDGRGGEEVGVIGPASHCSDALLKMKDHESVASPPSQSRFNRPTLMQQQGGGTGTDGQSEPAHCALTSNWYIVPQSCCAALRSNQQSPS